MFDVPEKYRLKTGPSGTDKTAGNNGHFVVHSGKLRRRLFVQASDGEGWEHVSVSCRDRTPTWGEMDHVKRLFWFADDFVVQMHVAASEHINCHPHCLHLWRKAGTNDYCEKPPSILVGYNTGHQLP